MSSPSKSMYHHHTSMIQNPSSSVPDSPSAQIPTHIDMMMKEHYEMLQVHSFKTHNELLIARGRQPHRGFKETQTTSRSLDRSESTTSVKHLHSKFNSCVELRKGFHSNSNYVMNSNSYHAPHPQQQQQQHYNMNTAQRGSSSRPNVQTYPHHKLYNPPPQHQPWRPMAPNNVAKIRYPPPPPPPPPPSNGRSASSTGYRGGGGGISTHYSNMNSNHHHLNNNIVSNNSNAVTPHLKNYQHSNSSPPNSSTTSSMVKGSGGSGAPVLMQQYYQQQTSSSSSYPPPPHTHQQQALHTPQQPAHRRIITNLNAAQQSSVVNRRLDMSPESNKDTYHSSHGEFSSTTSRMQVVTQQTQQQQQQSGQLNNKNTNRRRSSGTGQLAIKRSDQAPVTLKGWLFKQGSDGLMLWKKRWFVLSEFCLFYYRSSDEDKVSGSILLPSYRISPVIKEDGVVYHKKYTFKAEHHNMRTYFFAAETKDSMIQWMNALSLASILQQHQELKMNPPVVLPPSSNQQQQSQQLQQQQQQQRSYIVKQQTPPQSSSSTNHNSVKVIQHHPPAVYQMFNSNGTAYVPAALTTTSSSSKVINYNTNNIGNNNSSNNSMNGPQDIENGGIQPLYANAPPKPARRLNSSRDYSPDSDSERGMMNTPYLQQPQNSTLQWPNPQPSSTQSRLPLERRTPEAYARSQNHQIFHHKNGDYEDPSLMTRPPFPNYRLSQNRLNDPRYMDNSFSPFSVNENTTPTISNNNNIGFSPTKQRTQRPHSADFLEYDKSMIHHPRSTQDDQVITNNRRRSGGQNSQPPRPKSSIDQPRMFKNEEEFHLWSEESYAQKMREQQQLLHHQQQVFSTNPNSRSQSRMSFARESNFNDSEAEVEKYFPTPMPRTPKNNSYIHPSNSNNQYQNLPLPPSTSSSQNTPMSYNSHGSEVRLDAITPNRLSEMGIMMNDPLNEDNGEFKRSSSARLPRQRRNNQDTLPNEDPKKKDQEISKLFFQREESMKRLLEWKQRMLQSPLTRKSSRNASRTQTPTNSTSPIPSAFVFAPSSHDYIKQKVLEEFDKQDISSSHSLTSHHRSFHISSSSSEKRLSRKGSSGSRSSRSRSSPRFGSRRDLSSSDEDEPPMEARMSRRRKSSSSSQIRSRASSRDSKKSSSSNKRGSYTEIMAQVVEQQQIHQDTQPEYININSLEDTLAKQRAGGELSVIQRFTDKSKRPQQYIGPDDWYKDDFDYDKFHSSFLQDPLLNHQYGLLLNDKKKPDGPDLEVQLVKRPSLGHGSATGKEEEDSLKYPDSAYETMTFRVNNRQSTENSRDAHLHHIQQQRDDHFKNSFSLEDINEALDDENFNNSSFSQFNDKYSVSQSEMRKRSVKELLSNFETKNNGENIQRDDNIPEQETQTQIPRRRVCSDTETLLYDTSSDEAPPLPLKCGPPPSFEQEYLPMMNRKNGESFSVFGNIQTEDSHYVAMIPAKMTHQSSSSALMRKKSLPSLPLSDPDEPSSIIHSRTPSQTLVMEHLQKEMHESQTFLFQGPGNFPQPPQIEEDTYVDMNEDGTMSGDFDIKMKKKKQPILAPLESPRYCEIDESAVSPRPSHYEFLHSNNNNNSSSSNNTSRGRHKSGEVLYHEIPEEHKSPLRPIEGLPDILGNNDSKNRRESLVSSDQDSLRRHSSLAEESARRSTSSSIFSESTERRLSRSSVFSNDSGGENRSRGSISQLNVSDTFKPASFFLEHREKSLSLSKKVHHHSSSSSSSLRDRELPKTPTENNFSPDRALSHSNLSSTTPSFTGFSFNLTYRSVYDTEGEATASTTEEDKESDKDDSKRGVLDPLTLTGQVPPPPPPPPPPPKVPYYVSDILHEQQPSIADESLARKPRRSKTPENLLFGRKEQPQRHTPDFFTTKSLKALNAEGDEDEDDVFVSRSKSMEGHLNDGFKPARGLEPPPPPEGIPPLELSRLSKEGKSDDDYYWRENLRKASAQVISPLPPSLQSDSPHHHINGYIWDERSQRFYKLTNGGPSSKTQEQLKNQTFLGEGLPGTFSMNKKGRQTIITEDEKQNNFHNGGYGEDCPTTSDSGRNNLEIQEEDHRDQRQHRRRVNSTSQKRHQESVIASNKKIQENIWDLSSQDLLGKSHEELVLILIHLRRQSAALTEAIDASTAELENITNSNDQSYLLVEDLRNHIRDLEEQQARGRPIVSLVDNMVKLGTLYRGPEGAPLSHRLRNIPATSIQDEEISRESSTTKQRRADIQKKMEELYHIELAVSTLNVETKYLLIEHQELLQRSLEVVRQNINEDKQLSKEERDSLVEEQKVLENELSRVTNELETCQKKLDECSSDHARWEHDVLFLRQKLQASASRDMSYGLGQSAETLLVENELAQVQQRASELHKTRQVIQSNVDSLTKRPASASVPLSNVRNKWQGHENLPGLGDDNQIDPEQSKKVNSQSTLLSSSKGIESKTVRMVKRDSKERSYKNEGEELGGYVGIEGSSNEVTPKFNVSSSSPPPPPLPRGNYENLHDFLKSDSSTILNDSKDELASKRQQMPRTSSTTAGLGTSGPTSTGIDSKFFSSSSYKMMDMFKTNSKKDERPSSSLSAHERLFGSSRDNSMSPPISPQILGSKVGSSSGGESLSSSFSANSPIFKSAAAKAIIQEVGGSAASHRRLKKRDKKRSYTITGGSSSSAVIEALNDHAARACDDLDMERVLRGSSRPNAPDVVKSTLDKKDAKINPSSIDNLFGVPDKIIIPERYIPEADIDNLSREERQVRLKKADSIRRMLTENASTTDEHQNKEEKKQRERLLSLNQVLAREVMEKSRLVAGQSRMKQ